MSNKSNVIGIVGWKNSGKTALVVDLVRELSTRGYRVSTIKHAHHKFDVDTPGKDSHMHRMAGANEVMVASEDRWALMAELRGETTPDLQELVGHMSPADIILAEGFKSESYPKIEVHRDNQTPLLASDCSSIFAVVTPHPKKLGECPCPVLARDDLTAIVDLALRQIGRENTDRDFATTDN